MISQKGIDEYDWLEIFRQSNRWRFWPSGEIVEQTIREQDIVTVVLVRGDCEDQQFGNCGSYCSQRFWALLELTGGRWAGVEAWNDTTGWGCQDGVEWGIAADREAAWLFGLSEEGRRALSDPWALVGTPS